MHPLIHNAYEHFTSVESQFKSEQVFPAIAIPVANDVADNLVHNEAELIDDFLGKGVSFTPIRHPFQQPFQFAKIILHNDYQEDILPASR